MDAIVYERLTRRYGRTLAMDGLTGRIGAGRVAGLFGRNGAGKSTFLKVLYGLLEPDAGICRVLGLDPQADPVALRRKVTLVPEECHLHPWLTGDGLRDLLAPLYPGWDDAFLRDLADALDVRMDKKVGELSKGGRRKLQLLFALAPRPEVILLDEPFNGLDPVSREQVVTTLIRTLPESGGTMVLSSHDLAEVESICDDVLLLAHGRLVLDLPRDELRNKVRRVIATCEAPVEALPSSPLLTAARARGHEMEFVMKEFSEEGCRQLLANFRVRETRVEGLSLKEAFLALAAEKEERP